MQTQLMMQKCGEIDDITKKTKAKKKKINRDTRSMIVKGRVKNNVFVRIFNGVKAGFKQWREARKQKKEYDIEANFMQGQNASIKRTKDSIIETLKTVEQGSEIAQALQEALEKIDKAEGKVNDARMSRREEFMHELRTTNEIKKQLIGDEENKGVLDEFKEIKGLDDQDQNPNHPDDQGR